MMPISGRPETGALNPTCADCMAPGIAKPRFVVTALFFQ